MSIDHTAILAVGRVFDSQGEAETFLREHDLLDLDEEEVERRCGLEECLLAGLKGLDGLEGGHLNYFTGWGFYLGYPIGTGDPETFSKDFEDGMQRWDQLFKGAAAAEIIHEVQTM